MDGLRPDCGLRIRRIIITCHFGTRGGPFLARLCIVELWLRTSGHGDYGQAKRDYYEVLGVERDGHGRRRSPRVSQAGDQVSSGQESGRRRSGQAASRKRPKPSRCSATPTSAARYDRFGHAGRRRPGGGSPTSPTSTTSSRPSATSSATAVRRSVRRRRRGRRRAQGRRRPLRRDARPARSGPRRHERPSSSNGTSAATSAAAAEPSPARKPESCQLLRRPGQVVQSAGIFRVQTTCPSCHGAGTRDQDPCPTCRGHGLTCGSASTREVRFRPASTARCGLRLTGEGEPSPNGGPRGRLLLLHHVTGPSAVPARRAAPDLPCRSPIRRRRWGPRSKCRRSTAARTGRFRPARSRATSSACAAAACPIRGGAASATCWCRCILEVPKTLTATPRAVAAGAGRRRTPNVRPHRKSFFEKLKDYFVPDERASSETS